MGRTRPTACLILLLALVPTTGFVGTPAQEVYTNLKDREQIKTFTQASEALVCLCGCNLVLSTCPHVECPFGIPVRRFMEARIKEGMTDEQIVQGMQTGFGPKYRNDPLVKALAAQGRKDLVEGLVNGFGDKVSAHTSSLIPTIIIVIFSILSVLLVIYWLGRRRAGAAAPGSQESAQTSKGEGPKNESISDAMEKLDRLDK